MTKTLCILIAGLLAAMALTACDSFSFNLTDEQKETLKADAQKLAEDAKPVIEQAAKDAIAKISDSVKADSGSGN